MMVLLLQLPVPEWLMSVLRLSMWLAILVAIFVPLERLFAIDRQSIMRKGIATDLGYYFLNSLVPAMLLSMPAAALVWIVHRVIPSDFLALTAALPLWARVLAGLVAGEVGYYWGHRLSHEIPFLWRFHSIHHSAEHVDFLTNTHAHPLDMVFSRFCGLVPIYALGLAGSMGPAGSSVPVIVTLISTAWGFFIHANVRWRFGPLEWLVSTPAFHRWHHALDGPLNRNYSSTLPVIDWIFKTHYLPKNRWPKAYGIDTKLPEFLTDQLMYPLRSQTAANPPSSSRPVPPRPTPGSSANSETNHASPNEARVHEDD
jgi:sterol desaturase/sphingolipid hydroxylase (fatty acid hydroxylase superfamily)